jgi:hypothetical protein
MEIGQKEGRGRVTLKVGLRIELRVTSVAENRTTATVGRRGEARIERSTDGERATNRGQESRSCWRCSSTFGTSGRVGREEGGGD